MTRSKALASTALSTPTDKAPAVLLPYQAEAFRLSYDHQLLFIEKSRRTGLTYAFAPKAVLGAAAEKRPKNFYYVGYKLDMASEFIGYCALFAKMFDKLCTISSEFLFDDGSEEGIKALKIDFPSGKSIVALSSQPRSFRGMQGDWLIDEGAFHDNLREVLKAAIALFMWGGHGVVISTHDGEDNQFNTVIQEIREKKRAGYVQRITLKEALAQGLYKRICLVTGEDWSPEKEAAWEAKLRDTYAEAAEEELDVIPSEGSGSYLAYATIKRRMTPDFPVVRLTCPAGFERQDEADRRSFILDWLRVTVEPLIGGFHADRDSYFGQDFARSGDVSPLAFGQHDDAKRLLARFILEMRNVPFSDQQFVLFWILDRLPRFAAGKMDARGNGSALAEAAQQKFGFDRIEAVQASEKTYLAFMPKLKSAIDDGQLIMPEDEGTLDDLRLIKMVRGVPMIRGRTVDSKADGAKGKRHGDNAIALMHLVAAAETAAGPFEFESAGSREDAGGWTDGFAGFGIGGRDNLMGFY